MPIADGLVVKKLLYRVINKIVTWYLYERLCAMSYERLPWLVNSDVHAVFYTYVCDNHVTSALFSCYSYQLCLYIMASLFGCHNGQIEVYQFVEEKSLSRVYNSLTGYSRCRGHGLSSKGNFLWKGCESSGIQVLRASSIVIFVIVTWTVRRRTRGIFLEFLTDLLSTEMSSLSYLVDRLRPPPPFLPPLSDVTL